MPKRQTPSRWFSSPQKEQYLKFIESWCAADFRSNLLCVAWTGHLARLFYLFLFIYFIKTPKIGEIHVQYMNNINITWHRQHRIISPVPDLPCLHCGVQCRNCSGDELGTAWASWSPPSAAVAASGDAGELGCSGSASSSLSPGGARCTSGSDGVDSVASVGVETTGPDFMERVLRCNSSLARPASRLSSQEEHNMSSHWRGLTEGHRRLHVIQTGILIFHRVQWVNQSTSMNVCHTFPPTWTGD